MILMISALILLALSKLKFYRLVYLLVIGKLKKGTLDKNIL